ncbi:hypothetical protein D3C76_1523830 [compost metagenome]
MANDLDARHAGVIELRQHIMHSLLGGRREGGRVEREQHLALVVQGDHLGSGYRLLRRSAGRRITHERTAHMIDLGVCRRIRAAVAAVEDAVAILVAILGIADQSPSDRSGRAKLGRPTGTLDSAKATSGQPA